MRYFCPAKINLFLKIVGRRADGYHQLQSLFAFLDLFDVLEVEKSDKFSLEIDGEFAPLIDPKKNLFTEILDFFVRKFSVTSQLKIRILKNIPVGAGLGGGSSDAAYFMMALNKIFALNLDKEKLQKISFNFGSDIAFFFENAASLVAGCGEEILPYPHNFSLDALLVNPGIFTSTKEIYERFDGNFSAAIPTKDLLAQEIHALLKLPNDLTKPAIATTPVITEILSELENCGADCVKMSGSGSSCFGVFASAEQLNEAENFFRKKFPQFFVRRVKILRTGLAQPLIDSVVRNQASTENCD